ncbi:hypothetical protein [Lacinutrix chionoecetis]
MSVLILYGAFDFGTYGTNALSCVANFATSSASCLKSACSISSS